LGVLGFTKSPRKIEMKISKEKRREVFANPTDPTNPGRLILCNYTGYKDGLGVYWVAWVCWGTWR